MDVDYALLRVSLVLGLGAGTKYLRGVERVYAKKMSMGNTQAEVAPLRSTSGAGVCGSARSVHPIKNTH